MREKGVARFFKVNLENYRRDYKETFQSENENRLIDGFIEKIYDELVMPRRATMYSAGYDIFSPFDFMLKSGETIKIPTGLRCKMNEDVVLMIFPRSSLGFKYRMMLENTVGIIDSDYYNSDNEGHIFIKFTNHGNKELIVKKGTAFAQGIFINYLLTEDDDVSCVRNGGIGSTNVK